ncbi:hypothetical protein SBA6_660018 [Candidatus Sulfopaludibacter sp. SbA6]|nr:hypothetical protein SBA6_660018 [Candidatus Sulfopaludibacter sp. SbA6]
MQNGGMAAARAAGRQSERPKRAIASDQPARSEHSEAEHLLAITVIILAVLVAVALRS